MKIYKDEEALEKCRALPWLHIKQREANETSLHQCMREASKEGGNKMPTVWFKVDGKPLLVATLTQIRPFYLTWLKTNIDEDLHPYMTRVSYAYENQYTFNKGLVFGPQIEFDKDGEPKLYIHRADDFKEWAEERDND